MGCGASIEQDASQPDVRSDNTQSKVKNNNEQTITNQNEGVHNENSVQKRKKQQSPKKTHQENKENDLPPLNVQKPVAFDVTLDNSIDRILSKSPPKRLKRLQPIENAPRLTSEQLEEKLKLADEKRQQELDKRKSSSKKSKSRLHQNLQRAQDFEKTHQLTQAEEIEEKLRLASKNREAKKQAALEKKRLREERAQQIRERAKQVKLENDQLEYDVEKDENFNAEEDDHNDSWLAGKTTPVPRPRSRGDRVYSGGRESPHKPAGRPSLEHRGLSASTTDSFDYAYQRTGDLPTETHVVRAGNGEHDDFFDT